MDSPLSLVQSIHKCLLLRCAHLHDIPPHCSEVNGVEEDRRAGRERMRGCCVVGGTKEERRKENVIKN